MEDELHLQHRRERFMTILKAHSEDKKDPVSEWSIVQHRTFNQLKNALNYVEWKNLDSPDPQTCICSTHISNKALITNKINNKLLIIGAVCLQRWLKIKALCDGCECILGNYVMRQKENDWRCRSCSFERMLFTPGLVKGWETCPGFIDCCANRVSFKEAVENQAIVDLLLNLPITSQNHKLFVEYAKTVWELQEIEVLE